jgi:hypothetical protein
MASDFSISSLNLNLEAGLSKTSTTGYILCDEWTHASSMDYVQRVRVHINALSCSRTSPCNTPLGSTVYGLGSGRASVRARTVPVAMSDTSRARAVVVGHVSHETVGSELSAVAALAEVEVIPESEQVETVRVCMTSASRYKDANNICTHVKPNEMVHSMTPATFVAVRFFA